ncbi:hemolysin-III family protein [Diaporthe sp. PMI_573]|nr:hemolysin-III family protein [Diaporthaceae sp. PMI_573]
MDSTSDAASKAGKAGHPILLSFDEMPEWFRRESNQWILHGYRGLGSRFVLQLVVHTYTLGSLAPISLLSPVFMLTAVMCLSMSATYHTLMNHSQHVEHLCLRLDMLGIVIFILGDLVLGIYMVFWCEALPRNIYWSMIGVFGTLTIFMTMHPKFRGSKHRLFRALMFVADWLTRFPERQNPGTFDLWSSHSIFHFPVVCAAVVQLMGYLDAFDSAHANLTCSSLELRKSPRSNPSIAWCSFITFSMNTLG